MMTREEIDTELAKIERAIAAGLPEEVARMLRQITQQLEARIAELERFEGNAVFDAPTVPEGTTGEFQR